MTLPYHSTDIRNVALAGHGASGKTTLADALLFMTGATQRKGSVDDGTSTFDVEEEEKRRHFSIDSHIGHLEWKGKQVHLIDTPGYPDFIGNAISGLSAVENVLLAVSGPSGIEVNTRRLYQEAKRLGLGRFPGGHQDGRRQRRLPSRPGVDPRTFRHGMRALSTYRWARARDLKA